MVDRIKGVGATLTEPPERDDLSTRIAHIARMWAELHELDRELALELARKLPTMSIERKY